ncbi:DUF5615 family PIN-like protein [Aquisphaera insulae]|uniref:DUF5615 family PIN-like protein n=1 Tax=Aquisphaera insulae TaxID=2712864 RepID=UPI0013EB56C1|nr:DUF5615 family PIN-like protein [Aquisphaera insulae]
MSVQILIDMNLAPEWAAFLSNAGWSAVHWSTVGDPKAPDREIMAWAVDHGFVVFTHDLDFGALLALTRARGPSVLQIRGRNVLPDHMGRIILAVLRQTEVRLEEGALVTVDERRHRIRILPISFTP